jgi:hypothetical protein
MAVPALGKRTGFVAGIADWVGDAPPEAQDLAGHGVLEQGTAHVRTIVETGGRSWATDRWTRTASRPPTQPILG